MKKSQTSSYVVIVIVSALLIALAAFGIYKLTGTEAFDSKGGYIKGMASDKDVITFIEVAETPSYKELLDGDPKELGENPYKYYGTITSKEVARDKTAEYEMLVMLNREDSAKVGNEYEKTDEGLKIVPVAFFVEKRYNNFAIGDNVWMYGTFDDFVEAQGHENVPHFYAKKLVLDTELE